MVFYITTMDGIDEYESEMRDYKSNNGVFMHFNKISECEQFINYLRNLNIEITHTCCGGYGCGISKHMFPSIDKISTDYTLHYRNKQLYLKCIKNRINIHNNQCPSECCICYENTRRVTPCGHALCSSCMDQLKKQDCPYCRQII